jgi:hypothetical protein
VNAGGQQELDPLRFYLDPHEHEVATAAEVFPLMRQQIRDHGYLVRYGVPAKCKTCAQLKELRYGHCFNCAEAADPGTTPRPLNSEGGES